MKVSVIFVAVILLVASLHALPNLKELPSFDFEPFVIGGSEAIPHEFPWQLSLQYLSAGMWKHRCGASILSPKYGLTAAHCVEGRNLTLRVVAGLHKLNDLTQATIANVKSFKMHEKYNDGTGSFSNDIAILTFEKEIKFSDKIKPATIPTDNKNKFVNESCIISGWGRIDTSNNAASVLQKGAVTAISNAECQSKITSARILNGHICVFDYAKKTSACNGDSGGPVTCKAAGGKDTVVGVASWVMANIFGHCLPAYPSAYTRVSEYLDWIKLNTP